MDFLIQPHVREKKLCGSSGSSRARGCTGLARFARRKGCGDDYSLCGPCSRKAKGKQTAFQESRALYMKAYRKQQPKFKQCVPAAKKSSQFPPRNEKCAQSMQRKRKGAKPEDLSDDSAEDIDSGESVESETAKVANTHCAFAVAESTTIGEAGEEVSEPKTTSRGRVKRVATLPVSLASGAIPRSELQDETNGMCSAGHKDPAENQEFSVNQKVSHWLDSAARVQSEFPPSP